MLISIHSSIQLDSHPLGEAAVSAPLARAGCARGQQEPSLGRQMCREFYWLRVRAVKSPSLLLCSFYFCAGSSGVVLPPLEREPLMPTFVF